MNSPLPGRCALMLFALLAACAQARAQSSEDVLHVFYSWVLSHPSRGLPSAGERTELAKVLSPALIESLRVASEIEAKCIEAAPKDDKPYIVEGDLFVGNYEGATEVAYGKPRLDGDRAIIESDLVHVDNRFPKAHKHRVVAWRDGVELRRVDGRWRVEDVRFSAERSLLATLKSYAAEGKRMCDKPRR